MTATDPRASQAAALLGKGDLTGAEALFTALEAEEPENPEWPKQLAGIFRRSSRKQEELFALSRAADRYTAMRQQLRAIVMFKRMLDLDPDNAATRRRLMAIAPSVTRGNGAQDEAPAEPLVPKGGFGSPVFDSEALELAFESRFESPPEEDFEVTEGVFDLSGASPLFAALGPDAATRLFPLLKIVEYRAGTVIFRQGERGTSLYLIASGRVTVKVEAPSPEPIARLDEGEIFGELGAFTDEPRAATVQSETNVELIEIDRVALGALLREDPALLPALRWFLRDRMVDLVVRTNPLFGALPQEERRVLVRGFKFFEIEAGAHLITQNQPPRAALIILVGRAVVERSFEAQRIPLAELGVGAVVGEMSILSSEPAIASVIAKTSVLGLEIPAAALRALFARHPSIAVQLSALAEKRRAAFVEALERMPLA